MRNGDGADARRHMDIDPRQISGATRASHLPEVELDVKRRIIWIPVLPEANGAKHVVAGEDALLVGPKERIHDHVRAHAHGHVFRGHIV